jgi:alpha-ribazole phosphatase
MQSGPTQTEHTTLWLIRHGQPDRAFEGVCYGALDVALSPDGFAQMERVASRLADEPLSAVYSSPRSRCREGAGLIAAHHSCAVRISGELSEMDFGEFEGRRYDEIAAQHPVLYRQWMERPTETQFPGGENFSRMRERVLAAAERLWTLHRGQSIAVVTHGGVIRILLAEVLGIPPGNLFRLAQRHAAINRIAGSAAFRVAELINASVEESH